MKNNWILFFGLLFIELLVSCRQETFDTESAMLDYIRDESNGFTQHKVVNGIDYTLVYRPIDLLVTQELRKSAKEEEVEALREKYKQYMYFNLSMSKNNKELLSSVPNTRNEFGGMVNQLVYGMGDKVHVYTSTKDTLDMVDYVYPRMYGVSRSTTMLFVYPRDGKVLNEEYLNFTIGDLGMYTGEVKFKVPTKVIKNEPKISFKKIDK